METEALSLEIATNVVYGGHSLACVEPRGSTGRKLSGIARRYNFLANWKEELKSWGSAKPCSQTRLSIVAFCLARKRYIAKYRSAD